MDFNRFIYNVRSYSWVFDPRLFLPKKPLPIDRPIFLIGMQGGGLTLLSRVLRRHPDLISIAGDSTYWTAADEMQNTYGLMLVPELAGVRYKAPSNPRLPAPRGWSYACDEMLSQYRKRAADSTPKIRKSLQDAIRFAMMRHGKGRPVRFVDKSQSYTVRVGMIQEALKESNPHFVLVSRDPYVSVYRAARGRTHDIRNSPLPFEDKVRVCAEHFANAVRAAYEDSESTGAPLLHLRFEDLLAQPQQSLDKVCEFLGLDHQPHMLPAPEHKFPFGSRYADRWYPLRAEVNQRYIDKLDDHLIACVNNTCGDLVERLGYEKR